MTDMWRLAKAALAAVLSAWFGLHTMIQLLVYAIAFDIATGLVAGWVTHQISSDISRRGIARKVLVLLGVAAAELFGRMTGLEVSVPWGGVWGLGAAVAAYYAIHEAISIVENLARAGLPVPQFVINRLVQLRRATETKGEDHVASNH